ncbi:hypothetical protein H257_12602 [Aphanomyces astaci]|uniref:DM2 domain-containing protein n=1 Tax=Aphanomyces astaci TaxID=112090 RepID=W4G0C3_APHAT|nr:hypothetical protein H257_12602 [Aphanomyces astaci]ETV72494.1 hypothetical protein H257_12602 [Aphanomyces astaci]KAF0754991.1 hypothetical protein AaE_005117 [Aphanomyces astaci]RHX98610.1 hypothetical protein DYB25_000543 [Aphanomyces astaci]RHY04821.1 hypothetical protein DYB36_001898 [Aphanomyces astaci]RHY39567.1 hypothetical protein DYB30_000471 [Aphanomyces astaci]|eukprot:XP_009838176.1 hypothetical protein H257_12602 [Aphanomyces astaci]
MKKSELAKAIRKILGASDLETMSRKMVRKQLETTFGVSMEEYKSFINEEITKVIEEQEEDDSGDDEEEVDAPPPAKKAKKASGAAKVKAEPKKRAPRKKNEDGSATGGFAVEMLLSPELSEVLGITQSSRPQLVKKMWEYIREQGLQDPNDKRTIILNDALKNVFQRDSFTMFSMNKYLKRHVLKPEDLPATGWADIQRDGESSEEDEEKTAEKERKKAAKLARKTHLKETGEKPKRAPPAPNSGINAPLTLSEELSDLLGEVQMSRPQVVKKLWEYIKENNLQNPDNKQEINCDDTLTHLFGEDKVTMFTMNKLLKPHLLGKAKLEAVDDHA